MNFSYNKSILFAPSSTSTHSPGRTRTFCWVQTLKPLRLLRFRPGGGAKFIPSCALLGPTKVVLLYTHLLLSYQSYHTASVEHYNEEKLGHKTRYFRWNKVLFIFYYPPDPFPHSHVCHSMGRTAWNPPIIGSLSNSRGQVRWVNVVTSISWLHYHDHW